MILPYLFVPGKAPSDSLDFSMDFKNFLAIGETIATASVTATPSGLTLSTPTINRSVVTTFIGSGVADTSYTVSYTITTSGSRTETRSAILNCHAL